VSQFRQVTPRRLFSTPLLQLSTDRACDEILSCLGIWPNSDCSANTHLEFELLQVVSGFVEDKTDGDVMEVLVPCSSVCYAVIQASSKEDRPERLVIAYHDENCLRDLIAVPSIIGLGFASREEAIANLEGHMSDAAPSKQKPRITAMFHAIHANVELAGGHGLVKHCRIPQSILRSALAAVIALFYSKNIVSVVIRMALGASS
jgi:hypothetical protein